MRFVVRASNITCPTKRQAKQVKSVFLATNHSNSYGAKLKINFATDFEIVGVGNRLSF